MNIRCNKCGSTHYKHQPDGAWCKSKQKDQAHESELSKLAAENAELKKDLAGVCEYMLEITDMNNPDFGSKTVLQFAAGMGLLYTKARQVQEKWGGGKV